MAVVDIQGSGLGNALSSIVGCDDIEPGDSPSYEICKILWLWHPLGKKMVEGPIAMAQSQPREISIQKGPEDRLREVFLKQWEADRCDEVIYNVVAVSRAYGIGSLALDCKEVPRNEPIDMKKLANLTISFQVFDPLNTSGSLVLNQDPFALDFMKVTGIAIGGQPFHRSRSVTLMNERPVYIAYTTSAFGFVGRSVFQRALFPLKSFIQTMVTDDLVVKKAGVFIATLKTAGAIIDKLMQASAALKRLFVKSATNGNVISIGIDEKIETLNMQNIDGAYGMARKNILENTATAADMPAMLLKQETFAEGFGEGSEDAKMVAGYIDSFRRHIRPVYSFMDPIIQRRAWNEDFFKTIQEEFKEYAGMRYEDAFYRWSNSFTALWPNLLTEPDSEKVKTDEARLRAVLDTIEVFGPMMDPSNKALLVQWAQAIINQNKMMFQTLLDLNIEDIATYQPPQPGMGMGEEGGEPAPPSPAHLDSAMPGRRNKKRRLSVSELDDLVSIMERAAIVPPPKSGLNGAGRHAGA
jgi:hypothetical protein